MKSETAEALSSFKDSSVISSIRLIFIVFALVVRLSSFFITSLWDFWEIFSSSWLSFACRSFSVLSSSTFTATPFTSAAGVSVNPIPKARTSLITCLYMDLPSSNFPSPPKPRSLFFIFSTALNSEITSPSSIFLLSPSIATIL